jgi:outer membrane biosynthesis protein TonB
MERASSNAPKHPRPVRANETEARIQHKLGDNRDDLRVGQIGERLRIVQVAQPATATAVTPPTPPAPPTEPQGDWLESWVDRLEVAVTGGLREDADDFRNRLTVSPHPAYPELAQRVGIQGVVKLQVRVLKDGHVEVLKLLQGEPVLGILGATVARADVLDDIKKKGTLVVGTKADYRPFRVP